MGEALTLRKEQHVCPSLEIVDEESHWPVALVLEEVIMCIFKCRLQCRLS